MHMLSRGKRFCRAIAALTVAGAIALMAGCSAGQSGAWLLPKPAQQEGAGYTLQLTDTQRGSCEQAAYNVLVWFRSGYYPILLNAPAEVDEAGLVCVPETIKVPAVVSAKGDPLLVLGAARESSEGGTQRYRVDGFRLAATSHLGPGGHPAALQDCLVTLSVSDDFEVVDYAISRENPPYPLTEELSEGELSLYREARCICGLEYGKTRAEDGSVAPFSQWERDGWVSSRSCVYEGTFDIEMVPLSDIAGEFFVQVEVTDADGIVHASDIAELPAAEADESNVAQIETDHGTMSFRLDGDHAVLEGYTGEDELVAIPAKVKGLPVTEVGDQAFFGNEYVREVTVPDTVTAIGSEAFRGTKIRHFAVPPKLKRLGSAAFSRTAYLEAFTQDAPNKLTSVQDGVLFSADGKTLLAYPSAKAKTYQIPDGVEVVAYAAFASAGITGVTFPESIREIEPAAFIDCRSLEGISLPDSLERLGAAAFGEGAPMMTAKEDTYSKVSSVRIGPKVNYIGAEAFSGTSLKKIEVDPKNTWYQSVDGLLLDADGGLIVATRAIPGALEIPEGVTALAKGSLDMVSKEDGEKLELFLPASLKSIDEDALPTRVDSDGFALSEGVSSFDVAFHAPAGSWAESFATEHDIECDNARDADALRYTTAEVNTPTGTFGFRVYGDHASLVDIRANDAGHMEVPAQVEGKPVTRIGEPEAAETSGVVKTFILPATVEEVEPGYLSRISGLRKFESPDGGHYTVRDGCLYSADGTTLVAYPQARGEEYAVPEGTVEIGVAAFAESGVVSVTLPDGLERIADRAFTHAQALKAVKLPASLKSIGSDAFSWSGLGDIALPNGLETVAQNAFQRTAGYQGLQIPDSVTAIGAGAFDPIPDEGLAETGSRTLKIGAGLERLEDGAFAGLDIDGFSVAGGNSHFKADGPFLLSKDGRILYACASGASGAVSIPDGVEKIEEYAFRATPGITDIVVPDSVLRASTIAFDFGTSDEPPLVHCTAGSEAERIVRAYGLNYTTDPDVGTGAEDGSDAESEAAAGSESEADSGADSSSTSG